ncbi:hypothetical protein [Limoniibacter endophyticus]|uniref:Uncharacterized protein n=1 Tax=Limoniibacter endophyticus TaxID=1565040 RepID=A0A8J3GJL0_9HYPH|nr:hypothetical protein [Limoniibacter endophyticus]GHC78930.1 hypothetical protein GCM10010136_31050 [Limoniibacter endophyticus]
MRSFVLMALASFMATSCIGGNAFAEEKYPCKPESEERFRWARMQSMDRKYLIRKELGPHTFYIPWAYFMGRQTPERVNCHPITEEIEFAFWMPDLRAPQEDVWLPWTFRPQEKGREPPQENEYVVKVIEVKSISPENHAGKYEFWFKNVSSRISDSRYSIEEKYSLKRIVPDVYDPREAFDFYAQLSDERFSIFLRCTHPQFKVVNPLCDGNLYLRDLGLEIVFRIPNDSLPQWFEIKNATHTLLTAWNEK